MHKLNADDAEDVFLGGTPTDSAIDRLNSPIDTLTLPLQSRIKLPVMVGFGREFGGYKNGAILYCPKKRTLRQQRALARQNSSARPNAHHLEAIAQLYPHGSTFPQIQDPAGASWRAFKAYEKSCECL